MEEIGITLPEKVSYVWNDIFVMQKVRLTKGV